MKRLLYVIVIIVFFLLGLGFYLNNPQNVVIKFYFAFEKELPLAIVMLVTLAVGILIGYFASLIKSLKLRRRLARANKAVRTLESERAPL